MSNVVDFAQAKIESQPHWTGVVKCVGCQHEWTGTAPVGDMWVECPECGFPKGHPKHPFNCAVGESVYTCGCGSEAMTVIATPNEMKIICTACGERHTDNII